MNDPSPWPEVLPADMPSCLARAALMTSRALARAYNAALRETGLPITQVSLLLTIRRLPDHTLTALADALALERTTLLRNLRQLEDAGFVAPAASRGRGRHYRLTLEGEAALARAYPVWAAVQRTLQADLGADGTTQTLATLKRLRAAASTFAATLPHPPAEDMP